MIEVPAARPKKVLELKIRKPKVDKIKRKIQVLSKLAHNNLRAKIVILVNIPMNPLRQENKRALLVNRVIVQV